MKKLLLIGFLTLFMLNLGFSQTILGLGDIAFTSYNSDASNLPPGTGDDAFTFVLLVDVDANTTINFTDCGWYGSGGFNFAEDFCTLTFFQGYSSGSQITISRGPLQAVDETTGMAGMMTGSGLELGTGGDQIFAYQGPAPTARNQSGFIAAIQMNNNGGGSASNWDGDGSSLSTSAKPSIFTSGTDAVWLGAMEVDNAQYDCFTTGNDPATIRAAVNNSGNWNTDNSIPYAQPPQCSFTCATTTPPGIPYLSSVNPSTNEVTISNCSSMNNIDVTSYRLCSEFSYVTISSSMVVSGTLDIPPGGSVVLGFTMDATGADLGFYDPTGSFTSPTAMLDFVQWGTTGNGRESVAVSKGIWVAATTVPGGAPYSYNGACDVDHGEQFWDGTGISSVAPGCNTFSELNVLGADAWFNIVDGSGNTVASINPNGNDLGTVSVDIDDLAASPQNSLSEYYLPRNFNFTSTNFDGSAMPFANGGVHIRLYFLDAELTAYNTASGSSETSNSLVVRHYEGPNEDCDVSNNSGTGDVVSTNADVTYNSNGFFLEFTVPHFSEMSGSGPAILAIELQSFFGASIGVNNELSWSTSSEVNSEFFIVERSKDGYNFEAIGKVVAAGNSTIVQHYEFVDARVLSKTSYYRLVEIDLDGERTIASDIIAITNQNEPTFSLAPNPTKENIKIRFTAENKGIYEVLIYDLAGKEVFQNTIQIENGFNQFEAETNQLNSGMYLLQIKNGKETIFTEKFMKE